MHKDIVLCDGLSAEYLQRINNFITEWESQNDSIEVCTSGSTGKPKKIILSKENVRASARATGRFFGFEEGQSLLLNLSADYIAGKLMIVRALEHKMKIFIAPNQENPLQGIQLNKIDFGAFVPYQLAAILNSAETKETYNKIRNVIIGGAPLTTKLEQAVRKLPNQTFTTFGMTETITHFALKNISKNERAYHCLPGIEIGIDERGCLIIEKNQISERLITNDLIEIINSKTFIWKGRIDNVINSAGIKISPEEIEEQIAQFIPNNRFYVGGRTSEKFGEELVLYVEGEKPLSWDGDYEDILKTLDKYHQPKAVIFQREFSTTKTGKILR